MTEEADARLSMKSESHLALENGHCREKSMVNGLGWTNGAGLTNGRGQVNGVGRTNGLCRAYGRVNGVGHVNGVGWDKRDGPRGFVNGRGLINGTRKALQSNMYGIVTGKDLRIGVSLAVLFVLLLPTFYLLATPPQLPPPAISIDGRFDDWQKVPSYHDPVGGSNPDVAITDYALLHDEQTVFITLRVEGRLFMESQAYDGFYAFIDTDGHQATGYWPEEIGAEYAVFITGGDGVIATSELRKMTPGADPLNFTAWVAVAGVPTAFAGNALEMAIGPSALNMSGRYAIRLAANDFEGNAVMASLRIGREYGALRATTSPRPGYTPLTPSDCALLHLNLRSYGKRVEILDFPRDSRWQSYPSDLITRLFLPNRLFINADDSVDLDVGLDLTGMTRGEPIWLNLTGLDANVLVTIRGDGGVGYVDRLPQYKAVDGWFGDWQTDLQSDTGPVVRNPDVDIKEYASNITRIGSGGKALFYVDFVGKAMGGSLMPYSKKWAAPSQPSPPTPPTQPKRVVGEDILSISIDSNSSDQAGCNVQGINADLRIEIRGHARKVDTRVLQSCLGGLWTPIINSPPLAIASGSRLEASIDLSLMGSVDRPEYVIESSDWEGVGDLLPAADLGTRSSTERTRGADYQRVLTDPPGVRNITSYKMSGKPTIDGKCSDSIYSNEANRDSSNASFMFYVGHYGDFLYVCIVFYDDTDNPGDYADLLFDSRHDAVGNEGPRTDDRRFTLSAGTFTLARRRGDGVGWVACDYFCGTGDIGNASMDVGYQNYEFAINQSNVWNGTRRAGFAIWLHNVSRNWDSWWGSWRVNQNLPGTWGHLDIPEFPAVIMPILIFTALIGFRRKRRHAQDPPPSEAPPEGKFRARPRD